MNITDFNHLISQKNLIVEPKDPFVVTVKDIPEGFALAKTLLYEIADKKTALFLSGGKTPKEFYKDLAKEEKLTVGAVGLIDERYGEPMHEHSNEQMIQQSGLTGYLHYKHIPFYPILCHSEQSEESRVKTRSFVSTQDDSKEITIESTAVRYDQTLRFLFNGFSQNIGVLGIGLDGHTAGIPINTELENKDHSLVTYFTDFPGPQRKRISMTFLGLSMLDLMLVMVFGEDKKKALDAMFRDGSEAEIPARFFKRSDIAQKTLVITDQAI